MLWKTPCSSVHVGAGGTIALPGVREEGPASGDAELPFNLLVLDVYCSGTFPGLCWVSCCISRGNPGPVRPRPLMGGV